MSRVVAALILATTSVGVTSCMRAGFNREPAANLNRDASVDTQLDTNTDLSSDLAVDLAADTSTDLSIDVAGDMACPPKTIVGVTNVGGTGDRLADVTVSELGNPGNMTTSDANGDYTLTVPCGAFLIGSKSGHLSGVIAAAPDAWPGPLPIGLYLDAEAAQFYQFASPRDPSLGLVQVVTGFTNPSSKYDAATSISAAYSDAVAYNGSQYLPGTTTQIQPTQEGAGVTYLNVVVGVTTSTLTPVPVTGHCSRIGPDAVPVVAGALTFIPYLCDPLP